jgi:aminoglycoside phosphotransferase family enzyme/predicted kinase
MRRARDRNEAIPMPPPPPDPSPQEAAQGPVADWLARPETHGGAPVETVVTHISRVYLAGDRALKLKRAVRTNYLDFGSVAARERFCRREIEVNAAAGALYRGVRPVLRAGDGFRLGALGETCAEAVDWVVEMARFDRGHELDRLLGAGAFDLRLADRVADAVAAMHEAAPRAAAWTEPGPRIDQIAAAVADGAPALAGAAQGWAAAARAEAGRIRRLLAARGRAGRVRRCHGDLHLGNVVAIDGAPTPFDAIEFAEDIARIDVAYDLAFLLADLAARGRPDLGGAILSRWCEATDDHAALGALPLFLSMRHAVLALVAAARAKPDIAAARLAGACAALAAPRRPALLAVGGLSGAGKTTLARALAPALGGPLGAVLLRSDSARKRLLGLAPETPAPPSAYGPQMSAAVHARLFRQAGRALRAGAAAALDATFLDPAVRAAAQALARRHGVAFHGLWLSLPVETAAARAGARRGDASDATPAVARAQAASRDASPAPEGWVRIDASGGPEATEAAARAALGGALSPAGG